MAFTLKSLSETFIAINRNWLVGKCDCVNSEVCVCVFVIMDLGELYESSGVLQGLLLE